MRLLDCCELIVDCEHKTAPTLAEGYPSIRTPNIGRGRFLLDGVNRVSEETYHAWTKRAVPQPGDLIMAREAPVGNVALIPHGLQPCLGQRTLLIRPDHRRVHAAYLTYLLIGPQVQAAIHAKTNGATVPHLNMKDVRELELPPLPPIDEQRRIAGILSAYDDLIENCERRIRVLDEMARALYREWFVLFRYPGHEKTPLVGSPLGLIPKGWAVRAMCEVADVVDCLHSKKPTESTNGPGTLLQLNNIGERGLLDMTEQYRISAEDYALWTSRIELQPGDCVITNVGRVGAVAQIPDGVRIAPGRNMTGVRARAPLTPTYLIQYLLSPYMASEIAAKKDLGTIMDSLNVKGIVRLLVPCPTSDLVAKFDEVVRPLRRDIEVLMKQSANLRKTRDLLLPRLLAGQLSVEKAA